MKGGAAQAALIPLALAQSSDGVFQELPGTTIPNGRWAWGQLNQPRRTGVSDVPHLLRSRANLAQVGLRDPPETMTKGKVNGMLRDVRQRLQESLRFHLEAAQSPAVLDIRVLSPKEALGDPEGREQFPLARGKEHLLEATFEGSIGQAFTPQPSAWSGTVVDWLRLDPEDPKDQPLVLAGLNALARHLQLVEGSTRHCRNEGPARCAPGLRAAPSGTSRRDWLPAAGGLAARHPQRGRASPGAARVRVLDLQPDNVGRMVAGVQIGDGGTGFRRSPRGHPSGAGHRFKLGQWHLRAIAAKLKGKGIDLVLYGTTAAGLPPCWALSAGASKRSSRV